MDRMHLRSQYWDKVTCVFVDSILGMQSTSHHVLIVHPVKKIKIQMSAVHFHSVSCFVNETKKANFYGIYVVTKIIPITYMYTYTTFLILSYTALNKHDSCMHAYTTSSSGWNKLWPTEQKPGVTGYFEPKEIWHPHRLFSRKMGTPSGNLPPPVCSILGTPCPLS